MTSYLHSAVDLVGNNAKLIGGTVIALYGAKIAFGIISANKTKSAIAQRAAKAEKDVPVILSFPIPEGKVGMSPPCVKVVTFLRLVKQPHHLVFTSDASASPTERLPCMELNGMSQAESDYIIDTIIEKFPERVNGLLPTLTADEEREGFLMGRLIDYSTRLAMTRHSIVNHPDVIVDLFTKFLGAPKLLMQFFIYQQYRKKSIAMLNAHGQGDLPEPKFYEEFLKDVKAIEGQLIKVNGPDVTAHKGGIASAKGFSRYDCNVFAFLSNALELAPHCKCDATDLIVNSKYIRSYMARLEMACDYAAIRNTQGITKMKELSCKF